MTLGRYPRAHRDVIAASCKRQQLESGFSVQCTPAIKQRRHVPYNDSGAILTKVPELVRQPHVGQVKLDDTMSLRESTDRPLVEEVDVLIVARVGRTVYSNLDHHIGLYVIITADRDIMQ